MLATVGRTCPAAIAFASANTNASEPMTGSTDAWFGAASLVVANSGLGVTPA
ncbi:hypothetical protein [Burkholderia ubonensis]|uniref:hypothetical protein n=1 Tax=Burkholderia ubonensis TaxID=101571 RepID=UPI0015A6DD20|nr:hypothetical protein [Burkholderia ubonensis]